MYNRKTTVAIFKRDESVIIFCTLHSTLYTLHNTFYRQPRKSWPVSGVMYLSMLLGEQLCSMMNRRRRSRLRSFQGLNTNVLEGTGNNVWFIIITTIIIIILLLLSLLLLLLLLFLLLSLSLFSLSFLLLLLALLAALLALLALAFVVLMLEPLNLTYVFQVYGICS